MLGQYCFIPFVEQDKNITKNRRTETEVIIYSYDIFLVLRTFYSFFYLVANFTAYIILIMDYNHV